MTTPQRRETSAANIAIVVPLYNPPASVRLSIESLAAAGHLVIAVDDGSSRPLKDLNAIDGCLMIANESNLGIAHSLNRGVEAARTNRDIEAVVTLDQDSRITASDIAAMADMTCVSAQRDRSCVVPDLVGGVAVHRTAGRAEEPIQSGTLIPLPVIDRVGNFDEAFFIDCVDTDFYLRCLDAGVEFSVCPGVRLEHELGSASAGSIFGWPILRHGKRWTFPQSSPFRAYYIVRNRTLLYRRHFLIRPRWVFRSLIAESVRQAKAIIFGSERCATLIAATIGLWHGLRGRSGSIPPQLAARLAS